MDWIASAVRAAVDSTVVAPLMGRGPLTAREIVGSPVRREILRLVRTQPGIAVSELRSRLDAGWGSVHYHLTKLRMAGRIEVRSVGRVSLVYLPGAGQARHAKAVSLLRGPTARRIAEAVLASPGCSIPDLVVTTGESPRVVYYHVKRLAEVGVITSASRFRHVDLRPSRGLEKLLRKSRPGAA
ncbi:MAG: hypothetical protein QOE90_266 [Thermoplasmata archaeon]|nr:hypothetical protein [Thermoplasmata archaeon]